MMGLAVVVAAETSSRRLRQPTQGWGSKRGKFVFFLRGHLCHSRALQKEKLIRRERKEKKNEMGKGGCDILFGKMQKKKEQRRRGEKPAASGYV